ncbi:hypothetical protein QAD02_012795 [Eretmocerus hayati]|uniref:Uncharacterized protein n=1 Tax=Eretmocerus hayati TaxID=131215 RepID=A0ACC2P1M4_9HYME|nr:hypothetical protein QAD02_012795 [Eretmocerus hayati]
MYNVPENPTCDPLVDLTIVKSNLKKVKGIELANIITRRIGQTEGKDKPRPIVIEMSSHADVMKVLGNKNLLPKKIAVATDKSRAQREKFNELRSEVDRLNAEKGSRCKIMKYIRGVPTIVDHTEHPKASAARNRGRGALNMDQTGTGGTTSTKGN